MAEWFWKRNYNKRTEKDYGLIRTIWYMIFVYTVVIPVSRLMYNFKIEGRENVPKTSKVIFAGNHVSYLDPPLLTYAVWKKVAYMGKKELFDSPNWLLRATCISLGGFAVNREKPELATFKTVKAIFNTDWSLGIFPQGHIVNEPVIEDINKGFTVLAKKHKADIVPVGVSGFDGYAHKLFEKHITMRIGKPISYTLPDEEIISQWAKQICELTGFEDRVNVKEVQNV